MKAVILDGHTINPGDLTWGRLESLCDDLDVYDITPEDKIAERIGDREIVITSKCHITRKIMTNVPCIKYIGEAATGYNNIDVAAAHDLGIPVTNIPSYATDAVAQHTMALILEITNNVALNNSSVQQDGWAKSKDFCYWVKPFILLKGKSLGIVGYGSIGSRVAEIAKAFGMKINIYSRDKEAAVKSDFVTLHCPLDENNYHFINDSFISGMKDGAVLINTARGALVDEEALAKALKSGKLSAAALDVLEKEPPARSNPLIGLDNCIITPHMAWSPLEMRQRIIDILADNIESWLNGGHLNRI